MTNSLLFRVFRHPVSASTEILDQSTEKSAILISALHGFILMMIAVVALASKARVTAPFTILYALLWGPPLMLFVSWLFSTLTWVTGRLCKARVERAKISVLQNWASIPLFALWFLILFDTVFQPSVFHRLPEWVGGCFFGLFIPLLLCLTLVVYGSGLRQLYGLTLRNAISRTIFSLLLNLIVLTLLVYSFFQAVSFNFTFWS